MKSILPLLVLGLVLPPLASAVGAGTANQRRRLDRAKISAYEPDSNVDDELAIDLDVLAISEQLDRESLTGFVTAETIYSKGGHSKPYAVVNLKNGLAKAILAGTTCLGTSINSQAAKMTVMHDYKIGDNQMELAYDYDDDDSHQASKCQVGGLVDPSFDGCLREDSDIYIATDGTYDYFYNKTVDNKNSDSIQRFSLDAKQHMADCTMGCPFREYTKFVTYYGDYEYANSWLIAALNEGETDFTHGDADWTSFAGESLSLVVEQGLVYLHVWMKVIQKMEESIAVCLQCYSFVCPGNPAHYWDEAVAYYSGSQVSNENSTMLYYLADIRCASFNTCASSSQTLEGGSSWSSNVNVEMFKLFNEGRDLLSERGCDAAMHVKNRIIQLMYIPLIQGALRYAHINADDEVYTARHQAEGATFAAAILPVIHNCSIDDAFEIHNALRASDDYPTVDYGKVKQAFERNYECMGLTCADIGGIFDETKLEYREGAEPCKDASTSGSNSSGRKGLDKKTSRVIIIIFVGIGLAMAIVMIVVNTNFGRPKSSTIETEMTDSSRKNDLELSPEENGVMS
eukprot:CAMPEP_0198112488 /NCGR_PEP_ID=MMETSP1442-20131203/4332_1 /TAXON_ID= /ORGANISM="Craspedostauros australis, Strain CCMP3328" /LENGTH=570 /DNA_ID=CAMNT_0043769279 /DNA_START=270 /DNA_END=1982 /DNA_ORIENTATION=+